MMAWLESWNLQRTFQGQTGDCHLGVHSAQRLYSEFENMGSSRLCSVCRRFGWHATQLLATIDGQRGGRASKRYWRHTAKLAWARGWLCVPLAGLWLSEGAPLASSRSVGARWRFPWGPSSRQIPPINTTWGPLDRTFLLCASLMFLPSFPSQADTWIRYVPCLLRVESRVSPCLPCACSVAPRWLSHPPPLPSHPGSSLRSIVFGLAPPLSASGIRYRATSLPQRVL
ncbi:hypothetical protein BJ166DRAFT_224347 [Pestalotiopsis sp. NC0098]|nr:hypothetical protein BJ166DRAFT_224347 [Pestalotiopsis sp. NC0098]